MKKGFTLVEVLAIVTIIGLIFILVIPKITNTLNNKKEDIDYTNKKIILAAAKKYVMDNINEFEKVNDNVYCLPLKTLVEKDYLDSKISDIINQKDITLTKSIKITYDNGFKYEIVTKNRCNFVINNTN